MTSPRRLRRSRFIARLSLNFGFGGKLGIAVGHLRSFQDLVCFLDVRAIQPVVDSTFAVEDAQRAYEKLAEGAFGKSHHPSPNKSPAPPPRAEPECGPGPVGPEGMGQDDGVTSMSTFPMVPCSTASCAAAVASSGKRVSGRPCSSPTRNAPAFSAWETAATACCFCSSVTV